jgi:hypothetical protein
MQGVQEVVPDLFRGQYAYETTCQVQCAELFRACVWHQMHIVKHWKATTAAVHVNTPGACPRALLQQLWRCA